MKKLSVKEVEGIAVKILDIGQEYQVGRINREEAIAKTVSLLALSQAQAREEERERIFQAISTDGGDFCKKVYKALGIKTSGDAERPNLLASAEGDK